MATGPTLIVSFLPSKAGDINSLRNVLGLASTKFKNEFTSDIVGAPDDPSMYAICTFRLGWMWPIEAKRWFARFNTIEWVTTTLAP